VGGESVQDAQKLKSTTNCLDPFVAHCPFIPTLKVPLSMRETGAEVGVDKLYE